VHFPDAVDEVGDPVSKPPTPVEKTLLCLGKIRDLTQDLIDDLKEEK
jgi:hypothetical protein